MKNYKKKRKKEKNRDQIENHRQSTVFLTPRVSLLKGHTLLF